jgi:transcriptional regulator MraZ
VGRKPHRNPTVLLGQYPQRLDEKNRLTVPAKFRPRFAAGIVVTRGLDGCLWAYTLDGWEAFQLQQIDRLDGFSREARTMRRFFFSAAHEATPDKQGRVALPAALMEHANLDREVVVTGTGEHLEIWNRDDWANVVNESQGSVEDVAERFAREPKG